MDAVRDFEEHLNNRGFKYVDDNKDIRYAFLCPNYVEDTYNYLIFIIDSVLNKNNSDLQITLETYEESTKLDFKLIFDYQNKVCIMSEFKIINL